MKEQDKIQEFNQKNSLYIVLHNYIVRKGIELNGVRGENVTKTNVKKYIWRQGSFVNSKKTYNDTFKIEDRDRVEVATLGIDIICIFNDRFDEKKVQETTRNIGEVVNDGNEAFSKIPYSEELIAEEKQKKKVIVDSFIKDYIINNTDCNSIPELLSVEEKKAIYHLVRLHEIKGFEEIRYSEFSFQITDFIKTKFSSSGLVTELGFPKNHLSFSGKIIEALMKGKIDKENEIKRIIEELKDGLYDRSIYKFLQNYHKLISSASFQWLISTPIPNTIYSRAAIENILKPINDAYAEKNSESKYLLFENNKKVYENYKKILEDSNEHTTKLYTEISNYLFDLFKIACDATVEKAADIKIEGTSKKYNFNNSERQSYEIFINVKNIGEGLAKNVSIVSQTHFFEFEKINIGLLKAGELRVIPILSKITYNINFEPILKILVEWELPSNTKEAKEYSTTLELQDLNVPWDALIKQNPYSIQIIEEKNKLYGRDEILEELQINILSNNIESYKIWGQKRVGKSSIVKTLKSLFTDSENTLIIYRSILGLRNPNPVRTLNDLGESICSEILTEIENKVKLSAVREQLKSIPIPSFDGSFYPLEKFISQLNRINPNLKFVIIIDEFDRINIDFFKASELGEGFSGSIGKALNENKNVGFILVGSENMQLLDRQGMNYNSYLEREVDTFKKETQYNSFKNIVLGPVTPYIHFSEEAIDRIFEKTNGNPYFTNLICKEAFKIACKNRDSFIDIHLAEHAIELIVKSSQKSHFEHFWGDGLTEDSDIQRERTADIRRRVLVSYSICTKKENKQFASKNDILRSFKYPEEYKIEKYEVGNIVTEFFNRKVFNEINSSIRIKPEIFESWLCGPGRSLMIEGVSDLELLHKQIELENEYALKESEIKRLSENFEYQGKYISVEKYKEFFNQFGGAIEQRKIFKLLDSIYYISNEDVNDFFKKEQRNIFSKQEIHLKEKIKKPYRDEIELYCFSSTIEENASIVESFKIMSHIRSSKTAKNIKLDPDLWKKNGAEEIIIIEPVIDETHNIIDELTTFITNDIKQQNISIRIVTLLITNKAKTNIVKATATIPNFKIIVYKEVEESKIKPFILGTEIFENSEEADHTFAEVRKKFPSLNRQSTLLVLLSAICPAKSCPILWHLSYQFKPIFYNEFGKIEENKNVTSEEEGEKRRDKLYFSFKEFTQKLNKFIINHLKNKAINDSENDWVSLKYIPRKTLDNVRKKWLDEGENDPIESYFDFIDYKEIANLNKELLPILQIGSRDQLKWMDEFNKLRRDPAHWEKPVPTEEEIVYFDSIKGVILPRLN